MHSALDDRMTWKFSFTLDSVVTMSFKAAMPAIAALAFAIALSALSIALFGRQKNNSTKKSAIKAALARSAMTSQRIVAGWPHGMQVRSALSKKYLVEQTVAHRSRSGW